jgi:hypothetical protein
MALGRRKERRADLFTASPQLVHGPGHPFYTKLNQVRGSQSVCVSVFMLFLTFLQAGAPFQRVGVQ